MKNGQKADLKYFPGITVDPNNWLQKKQRIRENSPEDIETNKKIARIKKIVEAIEETQDVFILDGKRFEKLIVDALKNKKKPVRTSFFEYCDKFFKEKKEESGYNRSKSLQTTITKLREFKPNLAFEDVTDLFYRSFLKHLRDKDYAENYVAKQITNLRRIMTQATRDKINTCMDYRDFRRKSE
jgi:hypothetical protein